MDEWFFFIEFAERKTSQDESLTVNSDSFRLDSDGVRVSEDAAASEEAEDSEFWERVTKPGRSKTASSEKDAQVWTCVQTQTSSYTAQIFGLLHEFTIINTMKHEDHIRLCINTLILN